MTQTSDHESGSNQGVVHQTGDHQEHPISTYLWIWGLLFVLSAFSYMVDYFQVQGAWRWSLILIFMMLKAGFIVAFFMHVKWERLAMTFVILLPPLFVLVFMALMVFESDYTNGTRTVFLP